MEKALQRRLQMDDSRFEKFWTKYGRNIEIKGDILLVWEDRLWHPKTRQEIYALLGVCKELNVCLPKLVVELIGYFIQQAKVFKDYRNNRIEIIVSWVGMDQFNAQRISQKYCPGIQTFYGGWDQELEINRWARFEKEYLSRQTLEWMKRIVSNWDRYRIAHYWRNRYAKLCGLPRTSTRRKTQRALAKSLCKPLWHDKKMT